MRNGQGKLVLDLFQGIDKRLFTVGRLDKDTSGLLIVTNDGGFANRIIHPSSGIQKEYIAKTDKEISADHLKLIAAGTRVEGKWIKPLKVKKVRKGTVKVVVGEGKKREVRHLIEAAGLEVKELKRIRIGGLKLGDLPEGYWRKMTEREKEQIFE
jgi:23S rRNA pseudouridine2605 synthase